MLSIAYSERHCNVCLSDYVLMKTGGSRADDPVLFAFGRVVDALQVYRLASARDKCTAKVLAKPANAGLNLWSF